jgi:hypothetical protein
LRERDRLEDVCINGRIVFRCFFKEWDGIVDFINLLKTKPNLLYISNQSVPRCKHIPSWL